MSTNKSILISMAIAAVLLTSCAGMRDTAQVRDDVYFMPSQAPAKAPKKADTDPTGNATDDYYDAATSNKYNSPRNYYDMAYNDPYYYNYGRFGFGTGMGWQSGWNGPGWGMGMGMGQGWGMSPHWNMGYGWGSGMGWNNPWMGMGYGWGSPWGPAGFNNWGWGNPYGWGGPMGWHDPFYGGYGYGPYWGPMGNCFSCYSPVIIGGSSGTVVGHRPSISGGGGGRPGSSGPKTGMPTRDPVSLRPQVRESAYTPSSSRPPRTAPVQGGFQDRGDRPLILPQQRPSNEPPSRTRQMRESRPSPDQGGFQLRGGGERNSGGGFDRSGGGFSSPAPSGGGSRPGGGGRPR